MRVALVGAIADLNFRFLKHQNKHKFTVLGQCWLRRLPRGGGIADNQKLRIPNNTLQKADNYIGLVVLILANQTRATPYSQTGTQAPHSPEVPRGPRQAWLRTSNLRIFRVAYLSQFKCILKYIQKLKNEISMGAAGVALASSAGMIDSRGFACGPSLRFEIQLSEPKPPSCALWNLNMFI